MRVNRLQVSQETRGYSGASSLSECAYLVPNSRRFREEDTVHGIRPADTIFDNIVWKDLNGMDFISCCDQISKISEVHPILLTFPRSDDYIQDVFRIKRVLFSIKCSFLVAFIFIFTSGNTYPVYMSGEIGYIDANPGGRVVSHKF